MSGLPIRRCRSRNADAWPIGRGQAGFGGHVGKSAVVIVAIETVAGALPGQEIPRSGAVY